MLEGVKMAAGEEIKTGQTSSKKQKDERLNNVVAAKANEQQTGKAKVLQHPKRKTGESPVKTNQTQEETKKSGGEVSHISNAIGNTISAGWNALTSLITGAWNAIFGSKTKKEQERNEKTKKKHETSIFSKIVKTITTPFIFVGYAVYVTGKYIIKKLKELWNWFLSLFRSSKKKGATETHEQTKKASATTVVNAQTRHEEQRQRAKAQKAAAVAVSHSENKEHQEKNEHQRKSSASTTVVNAQTRHEEQKQKRKKKEKEQETVLNQGADTILKDTIENKSLASTLSNSNSNTLMKNFIHQYLKEHKSSEITVDDMARRLFMDPNTLRKMVTNYEKETENHYFKKNKKGEYTGTLDDYMKMFAYQSMKNQRGEFVRQTNSKQMEEMENVYVSKYAKKLADYAYNIESKKHDTFYKFAPESYQKEKLEEYASKFLLNHDIAGVQSLAGIDYIDKEGLYHTFLQGMKKLKIPTFDQFSLHYFTSERKEQGSKNQTLSFHDETVIGNKQTEQDIMLNALSDLSALPKDMRQVYVKEVDKRTTNPETRSEVETAADLFKMKRNVPINLNAITSSQMASILHLKPSQLETLIKHYEKKTGNKLFKKTKDGYVGTLKDYAKMLAYEDITFKMSDEELKNYTTTYLNQYVDEIAKYAYNAQEKEHPLASMAFNVLFLSSAKQVKMDEMKDYAKIFLTQGKEGIDSTFYPFKDDLVKSLREGMKKNHVPSLKEYITYHHLVNLLKKEGFVISTATEQTTIKKTETNKPKAGPDDLGL